jgi:hypothetical protein
MPAGKVVPAFDRRWLALVLTFRFSSVHPSA